MATEPKFIDQLPQVRGRYRRNVDLSRINWFRVGGKAEVEFRPADAEDLSHFLKHRPTDIPITVLGVGSNLLVRDGGVKGVVIRLGRGFAEITRHNDQIQTGAAVLCLNVAAFALKQNIDGLSFLSGIPGNMGGAVNMNAGAYGGDMAHSLVDAEAIDYQGEYHQLKNVDLGYVYRSNTMGKPVIFTKATLQGQYGDAKKIKADIDEITKQRQKTQPIRSRTSGSTFKNPPGHKAWELIDKAGCRGLRVGGAQMSELHCNFIINDDNATAKDIETLGETVRKRVREDSGVELEWEIKIIGETSE